MDNEDLIAKDSLDLNLEQVDKVVNLSKDAVWVIEIEAKKHKKFLTGVCVYSGGFVLTSFFEEENHNLKLRRYDNTIIEGKDIKVVKRKRNWGFCLLQITVPVPEEIPCVKLATGNRMPFDGQNVIAIGHRGELQYSVVDGYIAYDCGENVFVPKYIDESCCSTDFDPGHYYHTAKWDYRIAGFCHLERPKCGSLHLELPLIEIHSLPSTKGLHGAPVFDANGDMLGLIIFNQLQIMRYILLYCGRYYQIFDRKKNETAIFQEMQQWARKRKPQKLPSLTINEPSEKSQRQSSQRNVDKGK